MSDTCPDCQGCGQIVRPVVVIDPDTGEISTREEAGTCYLCGGSGRV